MNDTSAKALYTSALRQKAALEVVNIEIKALRDQLDTAIRMSAPRLVHAVAYEATQGSTARPTEMSLIERIRELTEQIGEREKDLTAQSLAYEDSVRILRRLGKKLENEDVTTTVFVKSFIEGKPNELVRLEMGVSVQTVSYHKTKIYNLLEIQ